MLPSKATLAGFSTAIPFIGVARAGFPSPATDYLEQSVDLNRLLIRNPASTFICRINGDRMKNDGIHDGSLVLVDKSVDPANGRIAVVTFVGELVLARIRQHNFRWLLESANPLHPVIELHEDDDVRLWGIVTTVIRRML
jgi:DNA polymerase V